MILTVVIDVLELAKGLNDVEVLLAVMDDLFRACVKEIVEHDKGLVGVGTQFVYALKQVQ